MSVRGYPIRVIERRLWVERTSSPSAGAVVGRTSPPSSWPCRQRRSGSEVNPTPVREIGQGQVSAAAVIGGQFPTDRNQSGTAGQPADASRSQSPAVRTGDRPSHGPKSESPASVVDSAHCPIRELTENSLTAVTLDHFEGCRHSREGREQLARDERLVRARG